VATTLYYPQVQRPYLLRPRDILLEKGDALHEFLEEILEHLQHPPDGEGLLPGVPSGTRVLTHFMQGNLLILDLSPEFQNGSGGGLVGSYTALYSLVNTLTSLAGIDQVRFLVSNQEVLTFRGGHSLDEPFPFFPGAVDPQLPTQAPPSQVSYTP
jgi:germination protein M